MPAKSTVPPRAAASAETTVEACTMTASTIASIPVRPTPRLGARSPLGRSQQVVFCPLLEGCNARFGWWQALGVDPIRDGLFEDLFPARRQRFIGGPWSDAAAGAPWCALSSAFSALQRPRIAAARRLASPSRSANGLCFGVLAGRASISLAGTPLLPRARPVVRLARLGPPHPLRSTRLRGVHAALSARRMCGS